MTKQEEVQFKILALQASVGDIDKAKIVFDWLVENSVEDEVVARQAFAARQAQQMELFDGK